MRIMQGACLKFMQSVSAELFEEYGAAERYCREAPGYSLVLLRDFAYRLAGLINVRLDIRNPGNLNEQIHATPFMTRVPEAIRRDLNYLRLNGNIGAHPAEFRKTPEETRSIALSSLEAAHGLAVWYFDEFESGSEVVSEFRPPDHAGNIHRDAVLHGDIQACYRIGLELLERGRSSLEKNKRERKKSASRRDGRAFVFIPEDFKDAAYWFRKADRDHDGETGGHAAARFELGLLHLNGLGVDRDEREGEGLVYRAAEAGDANALCMLGSFYYHGSTLFPRDYATAFDCFRRAGHDEHPGALTGLARMYKEGQGVEKDLFKAFEFARRAAQAGFPSARYSLGLLYLEGRGVKRSTTRALEWLRLAARDGNDDAQLELYRIYRRGAERGHEGDDGVAHGEAMSSLRKALRARNPGAAFDMAGIHLKRTPPDYHRAVSYYLKVLEFEPDEELLAELRVGLPAAVRSMRELLKRNVLNEQRFHLWTMLAARFDENGLPMRDNPWGVP